MQMLFTSWSGLVVTSGIFISSSAFFSALLRISIPCQINCYSLNSVGHSVETISGPRRFLAVYFTSAIASNDHPYSNHLHDLCQVLAALLMILRIAGSAMSYWLSKAPAVGASGAIFGLVSSLEVHSCPST